MLRATQTERQKYWRQNYQILDKQNQKYPHVEIL